MQSVTASDVHKLFSMPWQEIACLVAYITFLIWIECMEVLHGVSIPEDKKSIKTPASKVLGTDNLQTKLAGVAWGNVGVSVFLFLYVGTAALCERSGTGTISTTKEITSIIKDVGLVVSILSLVRTAKIMHASLRHNGMVVSSELSRAINCSVTSLVGLPLCFASWFPLLALPGMRIAARWWFTRQREKEITPEVHLRDIDEHQTTFGS